MLYGDVAEISGGVAEMRAALVVLLDSQVRILGAVEHAQHAGAGGRAADNRSCGGFGGAGVTADDDEARVAGVAGVAGRAGVADDFIAGGTIATADLQGLRQFSMNPLTGLGSAI